jgi:hypothetical protein
VKAHIEWQWAYDGMSVFLFDPPPHAAYYTIGADGCLVRHEYDPHMADAASPLMTFRRDALQAILEASAEKLPPHDATVDALKDTRMVRDRLLSLVEHTVRGDR